MNRGKLHTFPVFFSFLLCLLLTAVFPAYGQTQYFEPYEYRESFDNGELNAWASYPPNQDTAYDPYTYPGAIRPSETNTCLIVKKESLWNQDQFLGAVKLTDCIFDRTSSIGFRYYIKTVDTCSALTVILALKTNERIEYTITNPPLNRWSGRTVRWGDLTAVGDCLSGRENAGITAVAVRITVPDADTDMPIFLGLDDIEILARREPSFVFVSPETAVLAEWPERVALEHFSPDGVFSVEGRYNFVPGKVELVLAPFTDPGRTVYTGELSKTAEGTWKSGDIRLQAPSFPPGLYRGTVTAYAGSEKQSSTPFIFLVLQSSFARKHPRLLFDDDELIKIRKRAAEARFAEVRENLLKEAARYRRELDPSSLVFDTDQFPEKDWLATIGAWSGERIRTPREALFFNALSYSLLGEGEGGEYCREVLLMLASWPQWNHPWMERRGFHTYYPLGEFAVNYTLAYDCVYGLLNEGERKTIRRTLIDNFILPAYETYVVDNQVTSNSSNWICHIVGGALFSVAAVIGDDDETAVMEPCLGGCFLKMQRYISTAFGRDGSYGEGFRYFNFAMQSFAKTFPAVERIFGVDLSGPLATAHLETLWASNIRRNFAFTFGDSEPFLKQESTAKWIAAQNGPMNSWTWLLEKTRDPVLSWLYNHLREFDTVQEMLYDTGGIPVSEPETLGNVMFFRDVGTAVFKSGWGKDDFTFVFRCGPFYNHQHMDQGSFFFSDYGRIFLEERYDGEHHYYDDPVYRTHAIQAISHNTILIDRNPQSQTVGDPAGFASGMTEHAVFAQWLDSVPFAFAAGDLGGVYRDAVKSLRRNVLYLKPRTIFIVDEIEPDDGDIEANLLFHTQWKKDIVERENNVEFHKDGTVLHLHTLTPDGCERDILTEPHFKVQYAARPLVERGYLMLSRKTEGKRLVMANLLTAAADSDQPEISVSDDAGIKYADVIRNGIKRRIALNTTGGVNSLGDFTSDALVLAVSESAPGVFLAGGTYVGRRGVNIVKSERSFAGYYQSETGEISLDFFVEERSSITLHVKSAPVSVEMNGREISDYTYDPQVSELRITADRGEGLLVVTCE